MSRSRVISSIAGLASMVAILTLGSAAIAADQKTAPPGVPQSKDIDQWKPLDKSMAALVKDGYRVVALSALPNGFAYVLQDGNGHLAACREMHVLQGSPANPILHLPNTQHMEGSMGCYQLVEPFVPPAQ